MNLNKLIYTTAVLLAATGASLLQAGIGNFITSAMTPAEVQAEPQKMRVLLKHDQPKVLIEVKGKYKIYDPRTNELVGMSSIEKKRLMEAQEDGLRWGEEFPGVHQLLIVPDNLTTTIVVDGIEYQGGIYIYDVGGTLSIVNKIDVEDFLKTILAKRYPTNGQPEELLAAIAIVARTASYAEAKLGKTPYWDVDATKVGYGGYAATRGSRSVEEAIQKTRYLALEVQEQDNGPFLPEWAPSAGGKRFQGTTYSAISLDEAKKMAENGKNAVEILKKAFPNASLQLSYRQAR